MVYSTAVVLAAVSLIVQVAISRAVLVKQLSDVADFAAIVYVFVPTVNVGDDHLEAPVM